MDNNSYAQLIDDFEKGLLVLEGESLTDYIKRMGGVDYDAKANGGLMYLKKGGKVVDIMPKSMSWKGKAKDYPGIHEVIKQNRKKKTGPGVQKKADGGLMSPQEYFEGKEKYMKEEQIENMRREYNDYLHKQKIGPRDEAANGGIMGYASGGGIQNLSDVYNNSSVLQDKYATQQDYLDLFNQNTTTTTTPTTSTTTTDLIEQAPAAILPPRVNPLIIPQGGDSSDGGITNIQTPQKNFIDNIAIPGVVTDSSKANQNFRNTALHTYAAPVEEEEISFFDKIKQFSPTYQFMKKGKQLKDRGQQAIENFFAAREAAKIEAIKQRYASLGKDYGQGGADSYDTSNMDAQGNYDDKGDPGQTE